MPVRIVWANEALIHKSLGGACRLGRDFGGLDTTDLGSASRAECGLYTRISTCPAEQVTQQENEQKEEQKDWILWYILTIPT